MKIKPSFYIYKINRYTYTPTGSVMPDYKYSLPYSFNIIDNTSNITLGAILL